MTQTKQKMVGGCAAPWKEHSAGSRIRAVVSHELLAGTVIRTSLVLAGFAE
jgi:hypothetical protein